MINTLKMLIRADLGNSTRFEVTECWHYEDLAKQTGHIHEDWWVINVNDTSGDPVLTENTQEQAEIYCGLANLLDTDDWDTLKPYLEELLPEWFTAP